MTYAIPILLAVGYAYVMLRFSVWQTAKVLDQNSHVLRDPSLGALVDQLADALEVPHVKVHVYEIPQVNGLAAPDGRIFLTQGFIDQYHQGAVSAEELAGVIAHELGHVALGHSKRRMIDFTGRNALFMVLAAVLNRFIPFVGIWLANLLSSALAARLSRRDEFEADAYASALLVKAGIGTAPQKSLLQKLGHLTGNAGASIPDWLRSHPQVAERIAAIETRDARWRHIA